MIYLLIAIDKTKSVSKELYNSGKFNFNSSLLSSLVMTILMMSEEIDKHPPKGEIREIEIGKMQIGVIEKDHLAYVFLQDTYDNESFTFKSVKGVIDKYHHKLVGKNFAIIESDEQNWNSEIAEILETMNFPPELLQETDNILDKVQRKIETLDTLFIADLDDGIVHMVSTGGDTIVQLLRSILSEIPFERSWIGETKIYHRKSVNGIEKEYEGWIIERIGESDFCILARCLYDANERDWVVSSIADAANSLSRIISEFYDNV